MRIRISWPAGTALGVLFDTPTGTGIQKSLPIQAEANTWGDEVYFTIPLKAALEKDARQVVEPGDICFWVQGSAMALPFGPTPISQGNESRLITACNVAGRFETDPRILASVRDGDPIEIDRAE